MLDKLFGSSISPLELWMRKAVRVCLESDNLAASDDEVARTASHILGIAQSPSSLAFFGSHILAFPLTYATVAYWNGTDNSGDPLVCALYNMDLKVLDLLLRFKGCKPYNPGHPLNVLHKEYYDLMDNDRRGKRLYAPSRLFAHSSGNSGLIVWWVATRAVQDILLRHQFHGWQSWMDELWQTVHPGFSVVFTELAEREGNSFVQYFVKDINRMEEQTRRTVHEIRSR